MELQSPSAQRFAARLKHLAYVVEHQHDVGHVSLVDQLVRLNSEIMAHLVVDLEVSPAFYKEHITAVHAETIGGMKSPEFAAETQQIRKATQELRNTTSTEARAPVLSFGTSK